MVLIVGAIGCNRNSPDISQSPGGPKKVNPDGYFLTYYPRLCPEERVPEEGQLLRLRARDDVLHLVDAVDSLEVTYKGGSFLFCTSRVPSYAIQKMDVHGWMYDPLNADWHRVFAVRTLKMHNVGLTFDRNTGVFTAEFAANNEFKGTPAFTFDINAVWSEDDADPEGEL